MKEIEKKNTKINTPPLHSTITMTQGHFLTKRRNDSVMSGHMRSPPNWKKETFDNLDEI